MIFHVHRPVQTAKKCQAPDERCQALFIRFLALFGLALSLNACTTATERAERKLKIGEPMFCVYPAKYEDVETALKQAMLKYPQRVDNTEAGIFETDYVKGDARFKAPDRTHDEFSSGFRYRILVRLVKGDRGRHAAVKVVVLKQAEIARDFFAQPDSLASDGLEEMVILYRIDRELRIARALQRANQKANAKTAGGADPGRDKSASKDSAGSPTNFRFNRDLWKLEENCPGNPIKLN